MVDLFGGGKEFVVGRATVVETWLAFEDLVDWRAFVDPC